MSTGAKFMIWKPTETADTNQWELVDSGLTVGGTCIRLNEALNVGDSCVT